MGVLAASELSLADQLGQHARDEHLEELMSRLPELRKEIHGFADDATVDSRRAALIRELRALGGSATSLALPLLADELRSCQLLIQATTVLGKLDDDDRTQLDTALDRIEAFARAELEREVTPISGPQGAQSTAPGGRRRARAHGVLRCVAVGARPQIDALRAEDWAAEDDAPAFNIERVTEIGKARPLITAAKTDLVLVDTEVEGARGLIELLLGDSATDAIPIVALGKWDKPEQAAPFVALGVARTLAKPASPGLVRRTCLEVAPQWQGSPFEALGQTTIDELSVKLAEELHRGLCDAAEPRTRARQLDLGHGGEILTVLWDAVARIRELVVAKSNGELRFTPGGPVATLPKAPWLGSSARRPHSGRAAGPNEVRKVTGDSSLQGRTIVVAEDDLSMNWFLSGVLRDAGATVFDAFDGSEALRHARRAVPDLVLSDVVMPKIDGHALCRSVKQDVVLSSVPVILLSWKQDLLERMRELGAGADGYLCKEAAASEILQRVQELLRPRQTVAKRLADDDTVRGRLDGLTAYDLLAMVCRERPNARVTFRDASYVHEIEVRGGRPVCATRTGPEGSTRRGSDVLVRLLGVGNGQFGVTQVDVDEAVAIDLEGTLDEQLRQPIAHARAAQGLCAGASLLRVERVSFDEPALAVHLAATPEPAAGLLRRLIAGASPRELIGSARAAAELVSRVLGNAARHGTIRAVLWADGTDVLPEAEARELAILRGEVCSAEPLEPADPLVAQALAESLVDEQDALSAEADEMTPEDDSGPVPLSEAKEPDSVPDLAEEDASAAALIIESDFDEAEVSPTPSPSLEAGPLGRVSRPPPGEPTRHETPVLASAVAVSKGARHYTPIMSTAVEERLPLLAELDRAEQPAPMVVTAPDGEDSPAAAEPAPEAPAPEVADPPKVPRLPMPSAWATRPGDQPHGRRRGFRYTVPLVFGLIGIALAVGARWWRERQPLTPPAPPAEMQQLPAPPPAADPAIGERATPGPTRDSPPATRAEELPVELPLTKEDAAMLSPGEGLLEVVAGRSDEIYVDHQLVGKGPAAKIPLPARPEPHEVRVKLRGEERVRYVVVPEGKRIRLRVAPPWSR
ncbi:MAG: response regulator [Deltaproteobacteria bacterium]|nr:response regulator [Deltaproteobacteria bacterium]